MKTNSFSTGAKFIETQEKVSAHLAAKYAEGRKLEFDKLNEPVLWAKDADDAHAVIAQMKKDAELAIDFLSDLTAYDNVDGEDGEKRFVLVHQIFSTEKHTRIRIKTLVGEAEQAVSITDLWVGANWLEREVYDMYGITFRGHPNLRRILMDERFSGHPLRKGYPIKQREPFSDNIRMHMGANPLHVDTSVTEGKE